MPPAGINEQLIRLLCSGSSCLEQAEVLIKTYRSQGLSCNVLHPSTGRTALMDVMQHHGSNVGFAIARR